MTSAIETALTELSANLRRMEQRHQAVGCAKNPVDTALGGAT